ncbi:hypothetical protein ACLOJK_037563 [Asimina triloba]
MALHHPHLRRQPWLSPVKLHNGVQSVDRTPSKYYRRRDLSKPTTHYRRQRQHHCPDNASMTPSFTSANPLALDICWPICTIHHAQGVELISDPVRSQPIVDHSSKKRQTRLLRRRRACLHHPPIITIFESRRHHHLILIFLIRANGSDPSKERRHDGPEQFFLQTIRPSNVAEPICSDDGDNRLPPEHIYFVYELVDVDPTLLPSIPTTFACIAFHHHPPASPLSSTTSTASCDATRPRRHPPAAAVLPCPCRPHDPSPARRNATLTTDVCIDDVEFATVPAP